MSWENRTFVNTSNTGVSEIPFSIDSIFNAHAVDGSSNDWISSKSMRILSLQWGNIVRTMIDSFFLQENKIVIEKETRAIIMKTNNAWKYLILDIRPSVRTNLLRKADWSKKDFWRIFILTWNRQSDWTNKNDKVRWSKQMHRELFWRQRWNGSYFSSFNTRLSLFSLPHPFEWTE